MAKPFSIGDLLSRIASVLRREVIGLQGSARSLKATLGETWPSGDCGQRFDRGPVGGHDDH